MAKSLPKDSQILLNILQVQNDMTDIIDELGDVEEIAADKKSYELLYFYTIKLISLLKNVHNKTKKESLSFVDDFTNKALLNDLNFCYPTLSKAAVVEYAIKLSEEVAKEEVKERYEYCITQSANYQG